MALPRLLSYPDSDTTPWGNDRNTYSRVSDPRYSNQVKEGFDTAETPSDNTGTPAQTIRIMSSYGPRSPRSYV